MFCCSTSPVKAGKHVYVLLVLLLSTAAFVGLNWQQIMQPQILQHFEEKAEAYSVVSVYPWIVPVLVFAATITRQFVSTERLLILIGLIVASCSLLLLVSVAVKCFWMFLLSINLMCATQVVAFGVVRANLTQQANPEYAYADTFLLMADYLVGYIGSGTAYFFFPAMPTLLGSSALLVATQGVPTACLVIYELVQSCNHHQSDEHDDIEAGQGKVADSKGSISSSSSAISTALEAWSWSRIQLLTPVFWSICLVLSTFGVLRALYRSFVELCVSSNMSISLSETIGSMSGWFGFATSIIAAFLFVRVPKSRVYLMLAFATAFLAIAAVQVLIFNEAVAYISQIVAASAFIVMNSGGATMIKASLRAEIEDEELLSRLLLTAFSIAQIATTGPVTALAALAFQVIAVGKTYRSPFDFGLAVPLGCSIILGMALVMLLATVNLFMRVQKSRLYTTGDVIKPCSLSRSSAVREGASSISSSEGSAIRWSLSQSLRRRAQLESS